MSLKFNDTTGGQGLVQDCEFELWGEGGDGFISGNTSRLAHFTRLANEGLNKLVSKIMEADGRWKWADTNDTTLPIATTDLVADQEDYTLDITHLKILRVEVKNDVGDWVLLRPYDPEDIDIADGEFLSTSGIPQYYDKIGASIRLKAASSYNSTGGLKVYYQGIPSYFSTSDTIKVPGVPALFHRYISLCAAYDMADTYTIIDKRASLFGKIADMEAMIESFYSLRSKDEKPRVGTVYQRNRAFK